MGKYDDIINLPHHKSSTRKQMSMVERAAQFAPYMSLSGYSDDVRETARLTDTKRELNREEKELLNRKINYLNENLLGSEICVTFFVPDGKKQGGKYETRRGAARRIDAIEKKIIFADREEVAFSDILNLEGDFPDDM